MKKVLPTKTSEPTRKGFNPRAAEFLRKIQEELPLDQADQVVAINMETGEYILAKTSAEATQAFWTRWPNVFMYVCRVDGGPSLKIRRTLR